MRESYKNSKKRVPVLAASLALTAVTAMAGVTGTAAWFTANRAATATASTFTAYAPNSSLTIKAEGITKKGTYATGNDSTVYVKNGADGKDNYLRDASYDASYAAGDGTVATGKLWKAKINEENANATPTGFEAVSDDESDYDSGAKVTVNSVTHEIYYAVSWTYTFTVSNPSSNGTALFFDYTNSSFGSTTRDISKGFRIAMNNYVAGSTATSGSSDKAAAVKAKGYLVWANDRNQDAVKTHVNGVASDASSATYTSLFGNDARTTLPNDGVSSVTATALPEYIGTFNASSNTIKITCTAWYEGTDTTNVTTAKAQTQEAITANLRFYIRDLA